MPDYNFKSQLPIAQIAQLLAQKPVQEEQMRLQQEQNKRQRLDSLLGALTSAAGIAGSIRQGNLAGAQQRQLQQQALGQEQLGSILNEPMPQAAIRSPINMAVRPQLAAPGMSDTRNDMAPVLSDKTYQPTFGQTASYDPKTNITSPLGSTQPQRLQSALLKAFPEQASAQLVKKQFSSGRDHPLQATAYVDSNGATRIGSYDPSTGKVIKDEGSDPLKGFAQGFVIDPTTGLPMAGNKSTGKVSFVDLPESSNKNVSNYQDLTPVQRKLIDSTADDVLKDDGIQSANQTLTDLSLLKPLLNDNSPQSSGAIQGLATRSLGREKGVTTDKDIMRNTGDQSYAGRFQRFVEKAATGKLDENDRIGFLKLADLIEKKTKARLDGKIQSHVNRTSARMPNVDRGFIRDSIYISQPTGNTSEGVSPKATMRWNPATQSLEPM